MSVGSSSLGRRVLILTTDATQLGQGLSQAKALTQRQTAEMNRTGRIKLEADLLKLRSDYAQAQRLARQTAQQVGRQEAFVLRADLARFQSDLRMAEREHAASIRRMQQQSGGGGGAGILGPLGGAVLQGVGIGTGIGLVSQGVGLAVSGVQAFVNVVLDATAASLSYNATLEQTESKLRGLGLTTRQIAEYQEIANKAVDDGRGTYRETLAALADLTPLARRYNAAIADVLETSQLLAALDPAQGLEGARIALAEALSGNFQSLRERYEIPAEAIQRLKDEGVPNLQIVQRVLADMGITTKLLAEQADTFTQRLKIARDEAQRALGTALAPLGPFSKEAVKELVDFLRDPATQAALQGFADGLVDGLTDLQVFLRNPETKQGLTDLITLTGYLANGLLTMGNFYAPVAIDGIKALTAEVERAADRINALARAINGLPAIGEAQVGGELSGRIVLPREAQTGLPQLGSPSTAAIAPESETQFDINANISAGERWLAVLNEARATLRGFAGDWDTELFGLFDQLAPRVRAAFDNAFGGLDIGQQFERGLGSLDTLTGRMVEDIQNTGRVSQETADLIVATLGQEAGGAVLALAGQYAELAAASDKLKAATGELESAQSALSDTQALANRHAEESREIMAGLQRSLSDVSSEAAEVARAYAGRLDDLRKERAAIEELIETRRRETQEQIDGLASVQAAKAKSEQVAGLEADQRATLLDFEEKIRAARNKRTPEGEREARALEQQRDTFLARSNYALDLERKRAAVAADRAAAESKAIEEQAEAQEKKDREAADAIDRRIADLQDEADQVARDYAARERAIRGLIEDEEERARVVAAADKKAIDDAQTRVHNAQAAKLAAQDEATAAANKATAMERQDTLLGQQLGKWREFIQYLQSLGIDVAKFFNGTGATQIAPPPSVTPGGGGGAGANNSLRARPGFSDGATTYIPPRPPATNASTWAGGGGGGLSFARVRGGLTVNGPLVAVDTVRETAELGPLVDLAAIKAAELGARADLLALVEDDDGGGSFSDWRRG